MCMNVEESMSEQKTSTRAEHAVGKILKHEGEEFKSEVGGGGTI